MKVNIGNLVSVRSLLWQLLQNCVVLKNERPRGGGGEHVLTTDILGVPDKVNLKPNELRCD